MLAPAITATLLGCGEDATSPTGLEPAPALTAATSLTFRQIDRHASHTCAVANDDRAYCWGSNDQGQLGNGSTDPSATPSLVAGGLRFRQVSVGRDYSCGVTKQDRVYCWGWSFDGQLGDGTGSRRLGPTNTIARYTPRR
jgi:alpha-tubulin suppressor-like RCC1 family protein